MPAMIAPELRWNYEQLQIWPNVKGGVVQDFKESWIIRSEVAIGFARLMICHLYIPHLWLNLEYILANESRKSCYFGWENFACLPPKSGWFYIIQYPVGIGLELAKVIPQAVELGGDRRSFAEP